MSRAVIFLLLFIRITATDVRNDTQLDLETDNLQAMQKYEDSARRQWELSSRMNPTTDEEEEEKEENSQQSSSEMVELFTWFPWFERNGHPTIHTIKAIAAFKKENDSSFPAILGIGSWHEITLFGKGKEVNSIEEPDASALCRNSAISSTYAFKSFTKIAFSICLLLLL